MLHGLHENSNQQKQLLNKLLHKISAIDTKHDQLSRKLSRDREESSYNPSVNQQTVQGGMIQTRALRLDFPRFVGNDPLGWVYRAEQLFTYHQTPAIQRMEIASFHLEGRALQWYRWMKNPAP